MSDLRLLFAATIAVTLACAFVACREYTPVAAEVVDRVAPSEAPPSAVPSVSAPVEAPPAQR